MGKLCQLSPELWPLIEVILCNYIELIFRGGVSCLPAALLFLNDECAIVNSIARLSLLDINCIVCT